MVLSVQEIDSELLQKYTPRNVILKILEMYLLICCCYRRKCTVYELHHQNLGIVWILLRWVLSMNQITNVCQWSNGLYSSFIRTRTFRYFFRNLPLWNCFQYKRIIYWHEQFNLVRWIKIYASKFYKTNKTSCICG